MSPGGGLRSSSGSGTMASKETDGGKAVGDTARPLARSSLETLSQSLSIAVIRHHD